MKRFTMQIAGAAAEIRCLFDSTPVYFCGYPATDPPVFDITITPEDLVFEQRMLDEEADREGMRRRKFTDPFLERTAIQRQFANHLLDRGVLLLHGSTIAADGQAYLFTAKCGVGKSTHTRLWREMLGDRAVMVNDDKTFLQIRDDRVMAFGSPWSGKHGLDHNICAPLSGICILERGTENRIDSLPMPDAFPMLLEQAFIPDGKLSEIGKLVSALSEKVPLWRMSCTKDAEAARVAFAAMSGKPCQCL